MPIGTRRAVHLLDTLHTERTIIKMPIGPNSAASNPMAMIRPAHGGRQPERRIARSGWCVAPAPEGRRVGGVVHRDEVRFVDGRAGAAGSSRALGGGPRRQLFLF
jgi:hypothetical protein